MIVETVRLSGAALLGYLAGTLPSADLAVLMADSSVDLRSEGSGNPGAANVVGLLGPVWGSVVMLADIVKGAVACVLGRRLAGGLGGHVAGVTAVVGHCFPVWNGGKGGKGIATSIGQCAATFPAWSLPDMAVAGAVAVLPRFRRRAFAATVVSSACWVAAGILWWKKDWPNLWGPPANAALPMAAAASSAVIISRFMVETHR